MTRTCVITKEFTFEAAHRLPLHNGKCRELHGHSYRVQVVICGPIIEEERTDQGMVVDFGYVRDVWKGHLEPLLDHKYLNDSLPDCYPTTAENLAHWILEQFQDHLEGVCQVRLWETESSSAIAGLFPAS